MYHHEIENLPPDWEPLKTSGAMGKTHIINLIFEPLPSITVFELAQCVRIINSQNSLHPKRSDIVGYFESYGTEVMRHFQLGSPVYTSYLSTKP